MYNTQIRAVLYLQYNTAQGHTHNNAKIDNEDLWNQKRMNGEVQEGCMNETNNSCEAIKEITYEWDNCNVSNIWLRLKHLFERGAEP